ncbi:hypothetical protein [Robertmurraya sp.]|uniref:hypothetical protein n=1 Tax=Robertmurraya sp. TaxID=2837525 RepID=UPI00370465BF
MSTPCLRLEKIWEDEFCFELNLSVKSSYCHSNLNFYTTYEQIDEFKQGLLKISTFEQKEYVWISGEDVDNVTHYVYIRVFLYNKKGHVGIEILLDNKLTIPDKMRSLSFLLTEMNQIDDFIYQLTGLIKEERILVEGIIPYDY